MGAGHGAAGQHPPHPPGSVGGLVDPVPSAFLHELDVVSRTWAMPQIHAPESMGAKEAARKRLALDELLRLQLILVMRKRAIEREAKGIRHQVDGELVRRFEESLPFSLTASQRKANAEIASDLASANPMHRLLQGDVGAGKTLVAVTGLLIAVQGGHQAALMAPTEVLAEQHLLSVRDILGDLTVPAGEASLFPDRTFRVGRVPTPPTPPQ